MGLGQMDQFLLSLKECRDFACLVRSRPQIHPSLHGHDCADGGTLAKFILVLVRFKVDDISPISIF